MNYTNRKKKVIDFMIKDSVRVRAVSTFYDTDKTTHDIRNFLQ